MKSPDNPYLSGKERLNVELTIPHVATAQWGDLSLGILSDGSRQELSLSCGWADGLTAGLWDQREGGASASEMDSIRVRRTLRSLATLDNEGRSLYEAYVLPNEAGIVAYRADAEEPGTSLLLTLEYRSWRDPGTERSGPRKQPKWVDAGKGVWIWPDEEYRNPCLGFSPPVEDLMALVDSDGFIHLNLPRHRTTQIVLARADNHDEAIAAVREYLGKDAEEVEQMTVEGYGRRFAFSVNTEDDQANQAIALLQSSLLGAKQHVSYINPEDAAVFSDLAAGLWLNSRTQPLLLQDEERKQSGDSPLRISEEELILWSANAVRTVSQYGILQDSKLSDFASRVISSLAMLDADYTEHESAILNPLIEDTLMQKALAYVRFANLMNLGEEISSLRGQSIPTGQYRRKALDATKQAQNAFEASSRGYRNAQIIQGSRRGKSEAKQDEEADPLQLPGEKAIIASSYPDTAAFLQAGARYGFNHISRTPVELIEHAPDWNPFLWQRWIRYRFTTSSALMSTSDSDSLIAVLRGGPVPGMLTDEGRPDLSASAQALQNISEIYLGIQPNWADHELKIDPRLPKTWGRTAARVPLGTGNLFIDYNLVQETATVRIEDIEHELNVIFYYPLPSEKTLRTQFKLAKERPEVQIFVTRDRGNRMRLEIE
ncbi:hypothetical protein KKH18_04690 [bacterium]|nr:hypothetical protein [bacterium]